ncbi:hypothetical protein F4804DRAFT_325918 [Jackrogersella minutella]|nr:hypothetical protein F4804DRAFT_325918 [Jackrogersella minutella]
MVRIIFIHMKISRKFPSAVPIKACPPLRISADSYLSLTHSISRRSHIPPTSIKMNVITQVLPIRYGRSELIEKELQTILGAHGFHIIGFKANQWIVKVSRRLDDIEISTMRANIRVHYDAKDDQL